MKKMSWTVGIGMIVVCLAITGCKKTVPNVVGQTQAAASTAITGAGFTVGAITPEYSSTVASGLVISQNPAAGASVNSGSAVALAVSQGPQPVTVPNVVGQTQSAASTTIMGAGLTVSAVTPAYSATIASGLVISQIPSAGASVSPGSAVALTVSQGPQPVTVPDVVGQTQSAASTTITGAGLTVGSITPAYSATVASGLVISQDPASGVSVSPGSAVALTVSQGPQPVTVPNVVDMTQANAQSALTTGSLTLGAVTYEYNASVPAGQVISQNPIAGASVAPGTAVALVVSGFVLTVNVTGSGSVALNPSGGTYGVGTVVTLTPSAAAGYRFDIWQGDLVGNDKPATITMDGNKTVTAVFVSRTFTSFNPIGLCAIGSTVYFVADDSFTGQELWKSDGTLNGTDLVKDILPDTGSSAPKMLTNINGMLYFFAEQDNSGYGLWKSDGTPGGTVKVQGLGGSWPTGSMTNANGTWFFPAIGTTNKELWKTDGTAAGTVKVTDFVAESVPRYLTNLGGTLYFNMSVQSGPSIMELWKSNGTATGTVSILSGSYVGEMAALNGDLLFSADDSGYGALWTTNGTLTSVLRDFTISSDSTPSYLTTVNGAVNDQVFFSARDETTPPTMNEQLWVSDGVSAGLVDALALEPADLIDVAGTLFFKALYHTPDNLSHCGLYTSTGGSAALVATINPDFLLNYSRSQANVNGILFFTGENSAGGVGLWMSDGTSPGTVLVSDINPTGAGPDCLTNVNGTLFFTAYDNVHDWQLWKSNGTQAGTFPVSCN